MDVSPKSGETLIVYHIHGQSVGWHLHNSVQTSRQPRSLNLTHSISLPERGDLPREALDYGSLSHTSKSSSTEIADKKGTEHSRGYKSFPMLCVFSENSPSTSPQLNKEPSHRRGNPKLQNLFIPESEVNEDEEDEDSEGDNLHKYYEGSSLQLQGNVTRCNMNTFSQAKENKEQGRELDTCGESKGTPVLMECDEQDWGDVEDFSKQTLEEPGSWAPTENLIESFTQNQTDYINDSSCNSSDGVLVNFSAIYNKTNNAVPATPLSLGSPVHGSGSVLQDSSNPLPKWSSHSSDPNCNMYPSNSDGFPSMEISDLTMCLQSQARLAGSTQNYYKLVTCDLSSQSSPSPPWSSLTSFSETQSHGSCSPPSEYFLFGHSVRDEKEKPKVDQSEHQGDEGKKKDQSKGTKKRMAHIKSCPSASREHGACASSPEVVRYTKAQRPTFLPIQPFVLQAPSGKQQSKTLGSLLNQYMSDKYTKAGPSKAPCKSKVHPHHVQPSPLGSSSNIHLEAATSSDSCSTCTSSPILPHNLPYCTQPSTMLGLIHQDLMNRNPHLSPNMRPRNPQSPEQTEGSPTACSSQSQKQSWSGKQASHNCFLEQVPLVQTRTPPVIIEETTGPLDASHPLHQSSSPAITSVISLTSSPISSLISLPGTGQKSLWPLEASSQVCTNEEPKTNAHYIFGPMKSPCVMRERQHSDSFSMTDRPPDEFCLSPEAPSDILSIDLLHKRSMLKAVSLAVDLIIAHFNSRQDPEEKIRLGNSSLCTTISILVLKQLYPAIQNILQDGLKAYKFDLIIGKRFNKLWNIVEATAQPGSSTRIPDSLVSVVKKCSQISSRMRLRVFIIDLLNLRALEFWIHHLYTCVDVVTEHYHQWGFLALAQGPIYGQLFQELLLLLRPLSLVPFELHLPPEPQSMEKQKHSAPLSHQLLAQSAQFLQMSSIQTNSRSSTGHSDVSERVTDGSWQNQTPTSECGTKKKENGAIGMENIQMPQSSTNHLEEKHFSELRWARLFGSGVGTLVGPQTAQKSISGSLRSRRPSEWLKLGASKVDLLAQSVWTGKWPEAHPSGNHDRDTANKAEILTFKTSQGV
ncbi:AP-4 complex accessory subunit RUSC2 isoform X3 [Siphateles boraxobius]|uniref:AP-4 complex accessory subunit RUSC2 isoform X3 n=1 Tax=Siphateles boraxobius TaxID=180520 RepID=UPI004063787D